MKLLLAFIFVLTIPFARCATVAERSLKICVASNAPAEIRAAAQKILAAGEKHPLLRAMAGVKAPTNLTDTRALAAGPVEARAYDHLVILGLCDDPLIAGAWQREAQIEPGGIYVFGFGHFAGDIGYIESDRNPFLHSRTIASAPFETEVITITGSTPRGVALAADAFLKQGLVNGLVAAPGWKRSKPNLLARDPLPPDFAVPDCAAPELGDMQRIGITQAAEDEYRGVFADAGAAPLAIWRIKYYRNGVWDGAGSKEAMAVYSAGLHRRAYANTLWCARFASPAEALNAAPKIAAAARLRAAGAIWKGPQPAYAWGTDGSPGPLSLRQRGEWLLLSTLPDANTDLFQNSK